MSVWIYMLAAAVATGGLIALQPPLNGVPVRTIGTSFGATAISLFAVSVQYG